MQFQNDKILNQNQIHQVFAQVICIICRSKFLDLERSIYLFILINMLKRGKLFYSLNDKIYQRFQIT